MSSKRGSLSSGTARSEKTKARVEKRRSNISSSMVAKGTVEPVPIGSRIRMLFDCGTWYPGTIGARNDVTNEYRIHFDDGDRISVQLPDEDVQILDEVEVPADSEVTSLAQPDDLEEVTLTKLKKIKTVESEEEYLSKGLQRTSSASLVRKRKSELEIEVDSKVIQAAIEDWKHCGLAQKTYDLSSCLTAATILEDYSRWQGMASQSQGSTFPQIALAQRAKFAEEIAECFDKVIGTLLLYEPAEKEQFEEMRSSDEPPFSWTGVYTAHHLLRLLLRLPECSWVVEGEKSRKALALLANDLLSFISVALPFSKDSKSEVQDQSTSDP